MELEVPPVGAQQLEANFLRPLSNVAGHGRRLVLGLVRPNDLAVSEEQVGGKRAAANVQSACHTPRGQELQHSAEIKNVKSSL